uniref:Uncharacterized protein n=1 Tax=Anguilla anguilla TaxID=7936 RepID=A0A0E9VYG5_ANGAN
MEVFVLIWNNK